MRRLLPALLATAVLLAACGSDSDGSADTTSAGPPVTEAAAPDTTAAVVETTNSPDTTPDTTEATAPDVTAADLAADGPYVVGVTTRTLPEGGLVEVWYPADESARGGTDTYDLRTYLPEGLAALIPPELDASLTIDATRDGAAATDGPFPLVLESHGAAGFRQISSNLAYHLATWGMVVAATDHPSRDTTNFISGTSDGQPPAIDQLRSMRTLLENLDSDPILAGVVDSSRVALGGHSAGGGTIAQAASEDEGILGYVSYASGLRDVIPDGEHPSSVRIGPTALVALGVRRVRSPGILGRLPHRRRRCHPRRDRRTDRSRRLRRRTIEDTCC